MKYFIDTEFLEGTQKNLFFGKTKPTIYLISIALVDESGREFYAISKDFNLKEAWNRWQQRTGEGDRNNYEPKHYWIRQNVLLPIFNDLKNLYLKDLKRYRQLNVSHITVDIWEFNYSNLKWLLGIYGRKKYEIANDVCAFIYGDDRGGSFLSAIEMAYRYDISDESKLPEFYGYYADYDWVVFCWLFGNMLKLPKGFPMYCRDLKQTFDEACEKKDWYYGRDIWSNTRKEGDNALQDKDRPATLKEKIENMKRLDDYPKQLNEHNALSDAKWNKELYQFLNQLKK